MIQQIFAGACILLALALFFNARPNAEAAVLPQQTFTPGVEGSPTAEPTAPQAIEVDPTKTRSAIIIVPPKSSPTATNTELPTSQPTVTATYTPIVVPTQIPSRTPTPLPTPTSTPTVTPTYTPEPLGQAVRVVRVENGDTIIVGIDGKAETVHLLGIDAPDEGQPGYEAATEALRIIVRPGQIVYLVRDVTDRDECDFLVRYVYSLEGKQANAYMVATGYAQPKQVPPDVIQSEEFYDLAVVAGQMRKGFWTGLSNYDGIPSYGLVRNDVILRNGPRNDYSLGSSVPRDAPVTLIGRDLSGEWVLIRTADGTTGWVHRDQLRANVDIIAVPVLSNLPPTPSAVVFSAPTEVTGSADSTVQTEPVPVTTATATAGESCDPSYPTVCVAPAPPVLGCEDIAYRNFPVDPPDPHGFDGDGDGVGCE